MDLFESYYKKLEGQALEEARLTHKDGTITKKALMLAKLLKDGESRKADLLKFADDPNWHNPGQWGTAWSAMTREGLIAANPAHRGYIIPGPNLQSWFDQLGGLNFDPDDYMNKQREKMKQELEAEGISFIDDNTIEFSDDYFN